MTEPVSAPFVQLLLNESEDSYRAGRYGLARAAAGRAVEAAEQLDDPGPLVLALIIEADSLRMQGDYAAALARFTRALAMADDPASRCRLDGSHAVLYVATAYMHWVECARFVGGIAVRELFGVLDAADRFLRATGRTEWRAGLLLERALIHRRLGELDAAVAAAEEALAAYRPDGPGLTLADYRFHLGTILREAGRSEQAEPYYQAILDDPNSASPYGRTVGLRGLAWCALDRGDARSARRHATASVREAEPLGDVSLFHAFDVLVAACRAEDDLAAAATAATRRRDEARRLGGHGALYDATWTAVDVALDREELDVARDLLAELDEHAAALDSDTGTTTLADEVAQLRRLLAELDDGP